MIVVSDATPLRHLIAIGRADLLRALFGKVIVPTAVLGELQHHSTPAVVRAWVDGLPGWVEVRSPSDSRLPAGGNGLDAGEREAICLTLELRADLLLMDDRAGRECALRLDLPVTGTRGVLEQADVEGLLADLPGTLAELQASGFYVSGRLTDAVLRRWRARHSQ